MHVFNVVTLKGRKALWKLQNSKFISISISDINYRRVLGVNSEISNATSQNRDKFTAESHG